MRSFSRAGSETRIGGASHQAATERLHTHKWSINTHTKIEIVDYNRETSNRLTTILWINAKLQSFCWKFNWKNVNRSLLLNFIFFSLLVRRCFSRSGCVLVARHSGGTKKNVNGKGLLCTVMRFGTLTLAAILLPCSGEVWNGASCHKWCHAVSEIRELSVFRATYFNEWAGRTISIYMKHAHTIRTQTQTQATICLHIFSGISLSVSPMKYKA